MKQDETRRNKMKQDEQDETRRNKTKQGETRRNKTKQDLTFFFTSSFIGLQSFESTSLGWWVLAGPLGIPMSRKFTMSKSAAVQKKKEQSFVQKSIVFQKKINPFVVQFSQKNILVQKNYL